MDMAIQKVQLDPMMSIMGQHATHFHYPN